MRVSREAERLQLPGEHGPRPQRAAEAVPEILTAVGRWTSDNYGVTILIQHRQVPPEVTNLGTCRLRVLQRVTWAESDDDTRMVPGRTEFFTAGKPATPEELLHWLTGTTLANL